MRSPAFLLLTHGATDLQILLQDNNGRYWRATPDKTIVRIFHEWLLVSVADVQIVALPSKLQSREAEASFTDWHENIFALWTGDENLDARPLRDAAGRLQLVLPKIEPTLEHWFAQHDSLRKINTLPYGVELQSPSPVSILVLSTDRGDGAQEPVATFTFLKRWLIGQGIAEANIREYLFLHPGERLESNNSPIDPAIARRIETAVIHFYSGNESAPLLLASMGGLPQIKPLLAELVVMLAGSKAQNLFKTELGASGLLQFTPIDTLRVRRQCLELVRRGALLDALAMAAPFHHDPDTHSWVCPLEQAARLLNGNPIGEGVQLPALQAIIDHSGKASCLLVAIRVETALLNERWLEAINGSMTFLEAALNDAIRVWATDHLADYQPKIRYMRFYTAPAPILIDKGAIRKWEGYDARPLTYQANLVGESAIDAWSQVLDNEPLRQLRQTIHQAQKLSSGERFRLVDYRNANTHGVMTQDEIDFAIKHFMVVNLWSQGVGNPACRPKPGNSFLARPLVQNLICHYLGGDVLAQALFQALIRQLEARLIDPDVVLW